MGMTDAIDLTTEQRTTLSDLLRRFLPGVAVWAYGSRVKWTARPNSDLDLVAFTSPAQQPQVAELKDALAESNLPFPVDLHVWDEVPERFREIIRKEYVAVQEDKQLESSSGGLGIADRRNSCTIGELCDAGVVELQTGPFGTQLHAHDYVEDGVPVVPTEAIRNRQIDHSVLPKISPGKAKELARHRLERGDILFARRGVQATGHIGCVREAEEGFLCGTGAIRLRVRKGGSSVNSDFLSHVLANPASVEWFKFHAIGATMPNLNEGIIRSFPLQLPPLPEQSAIAHILGTLDDKIELNRRMNETLEAMVRALFKSWFVDFDPVRGKAEGRDTGLPKPVADLFPDSFEDSELGEIPRGWRLAPLPEVIDVNPTRALRKGTEAPYLDMANMPTQGHFPEDVVDRAFGSGMRFANGDTLVARITPCLENGKTAFVDFLEAGEVGWGSTEYIVLRPKPPLPDEFAYCLARSNEFRDFAIQKMTGSSGRQRVPAESFSHFRVAVAPKPVTECFGQLIKPLFSRSSAASKECRTLTALRDTLLPKLISGELRVNVGGLHSEEKTR